MANETGNRTHVPALLRVTLAAGSVTRIALTRGAIAVAILIATGFVPVDALTDARPRSIPVSAFAERFILEVPAATTEAIDLSAARRDLAAALARLQAAWSDHGGPARDVTIERRTGRATSELVRYRVTETAGR